MADHIFDKFKQQMVAGTAADLWASATIYAMLVDSSSTYVASDAHNFLSDFTGNGGVEMSTTGYTAGGTQLTSQAATRDDATLHGMKLTAANITWTGLGPAGGGKTIKAVLLYVHTGVAGTSDLIAYLDSGGNLALNGGNVTLQWGANGVLTLS